MGRNAERTWWRARLIDAAIDNNAAALETLWATAPPGLLSVKQLAAALLNAATEGAARADLESCDNDGPALQWLFANGSVSIRAALSRQLLDLAVAEASPTRTRALLAAGVAAKHAVNAQSVLGLFPPWWRHAQRIAVLTLLINAGYKLPAERAGDAWRSRVRWLRWGAT